MPCKPKYDPLLIGPALVRKRAAGVAWKVLMREYQLGRARLAQLYAAELERRSGDRPEYPAGGAVAVANQQRQKRL